MNTAHPSGTGLSSCGSSQSPLSRPKASIPCAGDIITIPYPFVRDTYPGFNGSDFADIATWRPGVRFESIGPEDVGSVADAIGSATFTIEAIFKPGRFPTRVFFTRTFRSPDGNVFGKRRLHIVTLDKFRRLTRGYQHPFGIGEPLEIRCGQRAASEIFHQMLAGHASAMSAGTAETEGLRAEPASAVRDSGDAQTPSPSQEQNS